MVKDSKYWANNAAGTFFIAVIFFVVTLAASRHSPSGATSVVLWLTALVGVAALGAWAYFAFRIGQASVEKVVWRR